MNSQGAESFSQASTSECTLYFLRMSERPRKGRNTCKQSAPSFLLTLNYKHELVAKKAFVMVLLCPLNGCRLSSDTQFVFLSLQCLSGLCKTVHLSRT